MEDLINEEQIKEVIDKIIPAHFDNFKDYLLKEIKVILLEKPHLGNMSDIGEELKKELLFDEGEDILNTYPIKKMNGLKFKVASGVFVIYKKKDNGHKLAYVGETEDLMKSIYINISEARMDKRGYPIHNVAKKVMRNDLRLEFTQDKEENIRIANKIREFMENEFLFSYIRTTSKEIAFLIRGILIRVYSGQLEYNSKKRYQI